MIVIGRCHSEKIGSVISGTYSRTETEEYEVTLRIMKEATREDWINYRKENNLPLIGEYNREDAKFYWAHLD